MALSDFFRINMPYGIIRNDKKQWKAFNREYMPLGWNQTSHNYDINKENANDTFLYTQYKGASETALMQIAGDEANLRRNDKGEIVTVFFYDDGTNPQSLPNHWPAYTEKLQLLAKLEVK